MKGSLSYYLEIGLLLNMALQCPSKQTCVNLKLLLIQMSLIFFSVLSLCPEQPNKTSDRWAQLSGCAGKYKPLLC